MYNLTEFKKIAIALGVVAAVGLIAAIALYRLRSKRWEHISRLRGSKIAKSFSVHFISLYLVKCSPIPSHNFNRRIVFAGYTGEIREPPTIANPELIFKYETLREATSNFKAENKLGQGGFGSVFKARGMPVILAFN